MEILRSTYSVLAQDCQEIESLRSSSDSPCLRRLYVRALYALAEGVAAQMKRLVLDSLAGLYQAKEEFGFTEEEFARIYPAVLDRFGFREHELRWIWGLEAAPEDNQFGMPAVCYSKLHMGPSSLSGEERWDRVMQLRSRITRPANVGELEITSEE